MIYRQLFSLLVLSICLSGCFPLFVSERVAENSYTVGAYEVEEVIYREDGFPDDSYERVYRVRNGRFWTEIGSYANESQSGIIQSPEWVDGWLVIYSSSHLFLWQPDETVRHFDLFLAEGWTEYAEQFGTFGLNGHYDYRVTRFWVEDKRWFIQYKCIQSCSDDRPPILQFISGDQGLTYTINES